MFGCYCSVEGRTQKNSVFSDNWAQDDTPTSTGGLREVNMVKVLAPEWHGDIYTRFWTADGSCWQVDGSPVDMPHSTDVARHWEMQARRVYAPELARNRIDPPAIPEGSRVWGT
ncbi:thiamine biosynthesis protein ThiS [Bifidobacterium eulemuris]|uniref:Thiamine biosynthesis protein ThiS n=1 Tax=Bifidobacterium eulemuris TaxID=1765219 RepID=A0A7L9STP2_9BIFI|nr:thiamine biosynthesis protein ThiS [Bifidobacterium eulemuris]